MNWLTTLRGQLPLLLVMSPFVGFLMTALILRRARGLVRPLAAANVIGTFVLLAGAVGNLAIELQAEVEARNQPVSQISEGTTTAEIEAQHRRVDKQRAERLSNEWCVIDGLNLWPAIVLVVATGILIWQTSIDRPSFAAWVLLYQSVTLAALTAYDLRVYLITAGGSGLILAGMISQWGGPNRRSITGTFMMSQLCGSAFVTLGFVMLGVAVPWMRIEDSPTLPDLTWNIAKITHEIQRWMTSNQLAFQYANEVFPWILFVLSVGFAIQFGLFPFHAPLLTVFESVPASISVLYVAGLSVVTCLGWLRFVMPWAPELLVGFDWWFLIPSLGTAVWCSLLALGTVDLGRKAVCIYLAISGIALLGCYAFTRVGLSGAWLMKMQLLVMLCWILLTIGPDAVVTSVDSSLEATRREFLFMLVVGLLGVFASGYIISVELLTANLVILLGMSFVGCAVCLIVLTWPGWKRNHGSSSPAPCGSDSRRPPSRLPFLGIAILAVIANFFPSLMIRQCEPEFARIVRRFEVVTSATSARVDRIERHGLP